MLIYSFKFKWIRAVAWIVLLIILASGMYFLSETEDEMLKTEESVEAWQV